MRAIPLLGLVVIAYFAVILIDRSLLQEIIIYPTLPSGQEWDYRIGDLLVTFGLVMLYLEIFKATRTTVASVIDHGLSMALFIICILAFLMWSPAGTGTFFLITLMTLVDVVAGFTVTITAARRDFAFGGGGE